MSLSNLIRKNSKPVRFATATPATFATHEGENERTVASVATVAVAKPPQGQTTPPAKVGVCDLNAPCWKWLIHFTDRNPLTVGFSPALNQGEVLALYPEAVVAEPVRDSTGDGMPARSDEASVPGWLEGQETSAEVAGIRA